MIFAGALRGIEGRVVEITVDAVPKALPSFTIKGLSEAAHRESRVRVQASLASARVAVVGRVEVTCNAGGTAIDGTALDLGIALAVAGGSISDVGAVGELSLSGDVRPVRGVLPIVEGLKSRVRIVLVAPESAREAALVAGVCVIPVRTLAEALAHVRGRIELPTTSAAANPPTAAPPFLDMRDIAGQHLARRALEIAAAGAHALLLIGAPGAGKTMFARRLPGLLPPMTEHEALDVTRIHSAAGLNIGGGLITARPFRAPHHSTTPPGLVGGGAALPRPGEVSLAHNGVLFLDELPEFSRAALDVLVEPIMTGEVVLARASGTLRYPSRALLVASMAACPCGSFPSARCRCSATDRERYCARIPSRVADIFDVRVALAPIDLAVIETEAKGESSSTIVARVTNARLAAAPTQGRTTLDLLDATARVVLTLACDDGRIGSAADHARTLRVGRTIAHLESADVVHDAHIAEALELVRPSHR